MNNKAKIIIRIFLCAVLFMVLCRGILLRVVSKAQREYYSSAQNSMRGKKWLSMDIIKTYFSNGDTIGQLHNKVSYRLDDTPAFYFEYVDGQDHPKIFKTTKYEALIADLNNKDLSIFHILPFFDKYLMVRNDAQNEFRRMPYYTQLLPYTMRCQNCMQKIKEYNDTIINGMPCREFVGISEKQWIRDDNTGKFNIPSQYESHTWVNMKTYNIDSIISYDILFNEAKRKDVYRIENISHEDMSAYFDSIFDFDNPRYNDFIKYKNKLPNSMLGASEERLTTTNLTFPMVNIKGDTTTLLEQKKWVLLDLWIFGCSGCVTGFNTIMTEKETLGYRVLEKEGIKIMAVNPLSDNVDLIAEMADNFQNADIVYYAKGFNRVLSEKNYPEYYLISPDKQIIWRGNHLGDYSELLKAKEDYEKTQKTN